MNAGVRKNTSMCKKISKDNHTRIVSEEKQILKDHMLDPFLSLIPFSKKKVENTLKAQHHFQ